jgi:cytochrome b6-f complex iron-sulfur subunit
MPPLAPPFEGGGNQGMADKKKMSVAEMLAAARKADSQGGPAGDRSAAEEAPTPGEAPAEATPVSAEPAGGSPAAEGAPKPLPKPGAAGRPSVAEMMAMARAGKSGEAAAAAPPASTPPPEKAAPAPKPKPAAAAGAKPSAAVAAAPARDTASILAAARKKEKPGPMSKAEAAAKTQASGATAVAKPKLVVPPMPAKPEYAKPKPAVVKTQAAAEALEDRRDFFGTALAAGFWLLGGVSALWTLLTIKFMFPNVLREPPSKFKVGFPDAFPAGQVQEKFKAQYGIWVVNAEYNGQQQIVALKSVCTHLGCTPNWLEAEQKFKCPCHGSGFYKEGINFEGPAPRPLERYAIRLADDGQIEVDKSRTFQEEMGAWSDPSSFIPV